MRQLEETLFQTLGPAPSPRTIFILGAPRTGSTVFYQALTTAFGLPFLSNFANDHTRETPIIGILASYGLPIREDDRFSSAYGKSRGRHAHSEGSAIVSLWCGGGHPSETVSSGVLPDQVPHMRATLAAVEAETGRPLVIKNCWNCFRIASLAEHFPDASFIWIRRDVVDAARSDLAARLTVQGDAQIWNSATPRNVEELRKLPPARQVMENQLEFARAISESAAPLPKGRFADIWYEDFCADPNKAMRNLAARLDVLSSLPITDLPAMAAAPRDNREREPDELDDIAADAPDRWNPLRWPGRR